ncbi:hypothetical protein RQ831_18390 [Roseomonas gilardii]|uniref:Uncharacterized protein n=1 Tax=Roseomonas gilardii TaxID=257708 RepID=A0ABU3MKN5_9PROT|nr:hypothetical protein [Roseomonas gilardii]MDT8333026.1 hypothetical protein [Roseomonas gilardii]
MIMLDRDYLDRDLKDAEGHLKLLCAYHERLLSMRDDADCFPDENDRKVVEQEAERFEQSLYALTEEFCK